MTRSISFGIGLWLIALSACATTSATPVGVTQTTSGSVAHRANACVVTAQPCDVDSDCCSGACHWEAPCDLMGHMYCAEHRVC
jgi:hypothetical protein